MAEKPPSDPDGVWFLRQLSAAEKARFVVQLLAGCFMLGIVAYREMTDGPAAGAAFIAACALLIIGMGGWRATVSVMRRREGKQPGGTAAGKR